MSDSALGWWPRPPEESGASAPGFHRATLFVDGPAQPANWVGKLFRLRPAD